MNRRRWLMATVAGGAGVAGVGWQLWPQRPVSGAPAARGDDLDRLLWARRFEQPGGGSLVMAQQRSRPLLLNFWATWCPPCLAEMPLLDRFHRAHRDAGWQVIGLALDGQAMVQRFLAERPVGFPVGLAGADGIALARSLGNDGGQLPFTVVLGSDGKVYERKLGVLTPTDLSRWAADLGHPATPGR